MMTEEAVFSRLLDYLLEEGESSSTSEILALSDLDHSHFKLFVPSWEQRSLTDRQQLLEIMGHLTNERLELQFDRIYQLALMDSDAVVRRLAIKNLWESENPNLISHYLDMLTDDPDPTVQVAAINALGRYILQGQFSKISSDSLIQIEDALLALVAEEPAPSLLSACIESLGFSSRPGVDELIQAAYLSDDEQIKVSALIAMGRSANERWSNDILTELESKSPQQRTEAARAAGELELKSAIGPLIELLDDVNDDVRKNAIWSLGQIGGATSHAALESLQTAREGEQLESVIEEALEHIAFLEGTPDFLIYNFDDEEEELA